MSTAVELKSCAPRALVACGSHGSQLSLVIPAWNEEETIRQAIREAVVALAATVDDYEIIVVDDGSTDGTANIVRSEAGNNRRVRLLQHPHNLGYGAALRTGFRAAKLELVAFTDADCQFDLTELDYILPLTERYDIVCGYRIDRQDPLRRRFYSWGYNSLVNVLMGNQVRDVDCALKVFHWAQLRSMLPDSDNFFANAEMLATARQKGLTVVEVGVHHRPRTAGTSKVSLLDVPSTLSALLPFWWSHVLFRADDEALANQQGWFWTALFSLAVIAAALLFPNLDYPLFEPDEARYAEIANEMLGTGQWIVPTLHNEPYFDKPPLLYWLVAASFALFGTDDSTARLVPAVAAFGTVMVTFLFGRRVVGTRPAFLGALALTLTAGFVFCGRFLILDSLLSLFVTLSLFTGYEALRGTGVRWFWWVVSAGCCALGVLTKGPVALVLVAPPVLAYTWITRRQGRPMAMRWVTYCALVLLLSGPWYILIATHHPEFLSYFFWEHNVERFFVGLSHPNPIWFYVPAMLVACMPWSLLMIPFARFLLSRSPDTRAIRSETLGYFLLWAGWCLLFFSLARDKLPPYVLPALPAVAILLGYYLDCVLFHRSSPAFFRQARLIVPHRTVVILCGGAVILIWASTLLGLHDPIDGLVESIFCAGCMIGVLWFGQRVPTKLAWGLCCLVTFAVTFESARELVPAWAFYRSPLPQSSQLAELLRDRDTHVVICSREFGSIPFYLGRPDIRRFYRKPLEQLAHLLAAHSRTVLILKADDDLALLQAAVPRHTVTQVGKTRKAMFVLVEPARNARRNDARDVADSNPPHSFESPR